MTNEEAITYADCLKNNYTINLEDMADFCDMAIKALKQEDILNKIRAEIEHLTYYWCEIHPRTVIDDVLDIIDKYRESEVEE